MKDIVKMAENAILSLERDRRGRMFLKTNQIRKFLTAVNTVTNKVNLYTSRNIVKHTSEQNGKIKLPDYLVVEIKYLKVKIAYQVGREHSVKDFANKAKLVQYIDDIGDNIDKYNEFAKYVEALVAYHKFYGGKDN